MHSLNGNVLLGFKPYIFVLYLNGCVGLKIAAFTALFTGRKIQTMYLSNSIDRYYNVNVLKIQRPPDSIKSNLSNPTLSAHIQNNLQNNKCSCPLYKMVSKIISIYVETECIVQYFPHEALATELKFMLRVRVRGIWTRRRGQVISAEQSSIYNQPEGQSTNHIIE